MLTTTHTHSLQAPAPWRPTGPAQSADLRARPRSGSDRRLARRIGLGEYPTWAYAQFCRRHDLAIDEGVFYVGRPDPLPFARPFRCLVCGELFETAIAEVAPGTPACSLDEPFGDPARHELLEPPMCLGCGATASLAPAVVCAQCGALPCICVAAELG